MIQVNNTIANRNRNSNEILELESNHELVSTISNHNSCLINQTYVQSSINYPYSYNIKLSNNKSHSLS